MANPMDDPQIRVLAFQAYMSGDLEGAGNLVGLQPIAVKYGFPFDESVSSYNMRLRLVLGLTQADWVDPYGPDTVVPSQQPTAQEKLAAKQEARRDEEAKPDEEDEEDEEDTEHPPGHPHHRRRKRR